MVCSECTTECILREAARHVGKWEERVGVLKWEQSKYPACVSWCQGNSPSVIHAVIDNYFSRHTWQWQVLLLLLFLSLSTLLYPSVFLMGKVKKRFQKKKFVETKIDLNCDGHISACRATVIDRQYLMRTNAVLMSDKRGRRGLLWHTQQSANERETIDESRLLRGRTCVNYLHLHVLESARDCIDCICAWRDEER